MLLGHNGAGKTTLMSMMTGILNPTQGTVNILGIDIRQDIKTARDQLSLCPQYNVMFPQLTVDEHLSLYARLRDLKGAEIEESKQNVCNILRFNEFMNTKARDLSGGWKRRLCLAISLAARKPILILDEPTTGMDPEARRAIWDALLLLRGQCLILLTTHYMEGKLFDPLSGLISII